MVGFENYSTTSTCGNQPVIISSSRFSATETVPTLDRVGRQMLFLSTRTTANLSLRWLPSIPTSIDKWSSLNIGSGQ